MFITKKKLEKIVQERIEEREREKYLWERMADIEKELHGRIDKLCDAVLRLEQQKTEC